MLFFKLFNLIVYLLALLNVFSVMAGHGEPRAFKTKKGNCLSFNRIVRGVKRERRFKLEPCAPDEDDPDQWIYIRKINKNEGVFYNFAANLLICYNNKRKKFQIVEKRELYRGGISPFKDRNSNLHIVRRKLEKLWQRYEKCKKKQLFCSLKRRTKLKYKIREAIRSSEMSKLLTLDDAKWIVNRTTARVRHRRRKNQHIENLLFNLQDKYYDNGFYKIQITTKKGDIMAMRPKFMYS